MIRRMMAVLPLSLCASCTEQGGAGRTAEWAALREAMVNRQIEQRGVTNAYVLAAMRSVPRHEFVPERLQASSYEDHPLPIGLGQTISQPFIVAAMTEALNLKPSDKVLEIGTGSGYQAAVLAELVSNVYSIEIVAELADRAKATLSHLHYTNVIVKTGDGYAGWPEHAPFDAVIVTCAPDARWRLIGPGTCPRHQAWRQTCPGAAHGCRVRAHDRQGAGVTDCIASACSRGILPRFRKPLASIRMQCIQTQYLYRNLICRSSSTDTSDPNSYACWPPSIARPTNWAKTATRCVPGSKTTNSGNNGRRPRGHAPQTTSHD